MDSPNEVLAEHLDLSFNIISEINPKAFHGLEKLETVYEIVFLFNNCNVTVSSLICATTA